MREAMTSRLAVQNAWSVTSKPNDCAQLLGGVHAGPRQHVVVAGLEALGIDAVLREQTQPEQQAVRVRPVVEVTAVVVRLDDPHVRVRRGLIEPVAVGVGLRRAASSRSAPQTPSVRRWRRANTSVSNRNREWMSTTTWFEPCRSTSSSANRSALPSGRARPRPPASRRRCWRSRPTPSAAAAADGVRWASCVLWYAWPSSCAVVCAESTLPLQFSSTNDRSSTNDMQNAPPCLPSRGAASIHCSSTARSTSPASDGLYDEKASRTRPESLVPADAARGDGQRRNRSYHGSAPSWPCSRALQRIQRRKWGSDALIAACIASNVGRDDAVREQRRVERRCPLPAPVDGVGLALDGVHRGGTGGGDVRPRRHLGVVAPLANGHVGDAWPGRAPLPSAVRRRPSGISTSVVSCEVTSSCSRAHADRARVDELGVQAFLGLVHLMLGALCQPAQRARGARPPRGCSAASALDAERMHPVGQPRQQRSQPRVVVCRSRSAAPAPARRRVSVRDGGVDVRLQCAPAAWPSRCSAAITASAASASSAVTGRGSTARTAVLVEQRLEPADVAGHRLPSRRRTIASVERLVHVGDAPAGQFVGRVVERSSR